VLRTVLSGLRPRRLVPTLLAIVLAVGFVAGTLIFSDTAESALYDEYARAARHVGVAVTARSGDRLPPSTVDVVRHTEGVATADGRMAEQLPLLDGRGRLVTEFGAPGYGINVGSEGPLRGFDLRTGRLPAARGEAALDAGTSAKIGAGVGAVVTVVAADESRQELQVVGIVEVTGFNGTGTSTVVLTEPELVRLTGATGYREVVGSLRPGADETAVHDRITIGGRVRTGAQLRHDLAREASGQLSGLLVGLQLFAFVAVLVAGFFIYNTFSILMAQRQRETALLRCVGASRAQIFRLVLSESALVGLAGSALGFALGVAVAFGLSRGATLVGLPEGSLVLTAAPATVSVAVGSVVTVLSAVVPAFRATRVPPIAALRASVPAAGRRRALVVCAALAAALGTAVTVTGLRTTGATEAMVLVMAGGIGNFLALLLLSPLFMGRLVAALGWLPGRVFGVPARLAAANAHRNPGRTAATTATLLIGVALMAGGSTVAATVNRTAEAQLNEAFPVDYLLTPALAGGTVPATVAAALQADRTFALAAPIRQATATAGGRSLLVGTVDLRAYQPKVTAGRLTDFRPGTAIVPAASDALGSRRVGSSLELIAGGRHVTVTVAATVQSSSLVGDVVVSGSDFAALFPDFTGDSMVLVRAAPDLAGGVTRDRLDAALATHPLVQVDDLAEVRDDRNAAIDQFVALIAALLGFALVIAIVGIANTLSLSVLERTRESALIRALGLTRGQLRATLLVEALLMATAGALVGVAFGLLYGWLTTEAAFGAVQPLLTIPVGQLTAFVALAALAGTLAAVLPSRRAARLSVVTAIAD